MLSKEELMKLKNKIHCLLDSNGITRAYQQEIDQYFEETLKRNREQSTLNKEENYYKAEYQQIPVKLLTKENLGKLEEHCKKTIHVERGIEHSVTLELLYKYRELETEKQNVIERLEKDVVNITRTLQDGKHSDDYSKCRLKAYRTKTKEILSLVKGENDEL